MYQVGYGTLIIQTKISSYRQTVSAYQINLIPLYLLISKMTICYIYQLILIIEVSNQKMFKNRSRIILRTLLLMIMITYTIKAIKIHYLRRQMNELKPDEMIQFGSFQFWMFALFSFALSIFAGICSGLTVGYMSISKSEMELWSTSQDQEKRKMAIPILQILNNHHLLLSTLLLSNALSLEALPIFLDRIVPAYLAVFISTAAVVIFGQVIPQAYATGPKKTLIGYYMSPFIKFLQFILYPFVKPIVLLLDKFIEHDQGKLILTHDKIKSLLYLHNKKQYGYRPEQIQMLQNCLDLRLVLLKQAMIPLQKVYMVQKSQKFNQKLIDSMLEHNYSKFPVYEKSRDSIVGFVKSKNLLQFDVTNPISLQEGKVINQPIFISWKQTLLDCIDILKNKKINFAIVVNTDPNSSTLSSSPAKGKKCVGIITFKQIFERIVLKKFKDNDIRVHIHLSKQMRIDSVIQAKEQE